MENNPMRPTLGARTMMLPITFDYSGGRGDSKRTKLIWSTILGVIMLIVSFGVMLNKNGFFATNILIGVGLIYATSMAIRFLLMKEGKIRKDYEALSRSDMKKGFEDIWGIYAIDEEYPYYCRYRNGKSGILVRLNKDVILGKYSESEFEHYEAIGDAYNIAGASSIQICHVDYMDNVGTDERLEDSFVSLGRVQNPDVKDVLTDIYTYQQSLMMERVTTFDVYVFTWRGSDINAWNVIQQMLSCFLQANYVNYHILDQDDMRELTKTLFNVKDFSVLQAMSSAFRASSVEEQSKAVTTYKGITPIRLIKENGEEIRLGKTMEEKEQERRLAEKEKQLKKEEIKRRKSKKSSKKVKTRIEVEIDDTEILGADEVIDLF